MQTPIFLSCPKPFLKCQEVFLEELEKHLEMRDLRPMTLGRTEYSLDAPLEAIRRLMASSFGLLCIAFRRTHIEKGLDRPGSDLLEVQTERSNTWLTSPYCQIEPAMAYQIGLPILIWRESGVIADGLLDRGAVGLALPEFDLDSPPNLQNAQWSHPLQDWIDRVRSAHRLSGKAPQLW